MSKSGPIVLVEDDLDDKEIFEDITKGLGIKNEIVWFNECESALTYLRTNDAIFLIFCDINLPGLNGLEFKLNIDTDPELRRRSIPFLFFSTNASAHDVDLAYTQLTVQGFFKKGHSYGAMKQMLKTIYDYWGLCKHPNST
jgi:CheY-like chemotaxis protein